MTSVIGVKTSGNKLNATSKATEADGGGLAPDGDVCGRQPVAADRPQIANLWRPSLPRDAQPAAGINILTGPAGLRRRWAKVAEENMQTWTVFVRAAS